MAKIDTLFMTQTAEKPFGAAHTYIAHIREYPPPTLGSSGSLICTSLKVIKGRQTNDFILYN